MDKLKKLEDSVENLKKVEHSMEKLENSIASSTVPSASISSAVPSAIETVLTAVPPATISAGPSGNLFFMLMQFYGCYVYLCRYI
ncbi:uncharacterized protein LOC124807837 isoform X4 [Hydra vulgaris]|uniref:uncharacterized protein LOC124807837 isoform X4 n=1 Tax=Hydra vulgaris TaxID=6087 RepID=UPI0032E9E5CA